MFSKNEKELVLGLIDDRTMKLRHYAMEDSTNKSDRHSAIVDIQHLTSAKAKIEMEVEK